MNEGERLIDVPGQLREPSAELLRRLREIDPRAEVIYVGDGEWWLGRVRENSIRRATGRAMLGRIRFQHDGFGSPDDWANDGERYAALRQALLMSQGFAWMDTITCVGEPDALLEQSLRRLVFRERCPWAYVDEQEQLEAREHESRQRESRLRDRDLAKRLWSRSPHGRGNPAPVSVPDHLTTERVA